jgi:hypothetical protein
MRHPRIADDFLGLEDILSSILAHCQLLLEKVIEKGSLAHLRRTRKHDSSVAIDLEFVVSLLHIAHEREISSAVAHVPWGKYYYSFGSCRPNINSQNREVLIEPIIPQMLRIPIELLRNDQWGGSTNFTRRAAPFS